MVLFVTAHFKSDFNAESPRPNSLVYLTDKDKIVATWNTYEEMLDEYTAPYFEKCFRGTGNAWFGSKNGSQFHLKRLRRHEIMIPNLIFRLKKLIIEVPEGRIYIT